MTYNIKVTLDGIKGFHRIYTINGSQSLYILHKRMRSDMEFAQDQLILFKAFDDHMAQGGVVARYGLFDLGDGVVDDITLDAVAKKGIASFRYFYDVTSKKSVIVDIKGTSDEPSGAPELIDVKGPNPIEFENGYVAFEDLPDDRKKPVFDDEEDEKKPRRKSLADILGIDLDGDDGDDEDEEDDDEDDGEEDEDGEEEELIYDENEQ